MVTIATRKKCPACRFDKCLNMGMKLEGKDHHNVTNIFHDLIYLFDFFFISAIRVDRTRGGRSTYPFSYTLPASITQMQNSNDASINMVKQESTSDASPPSPQIPNRLIPPLLQVRRVALVIKSLLIDFHHYLSLFY